MAVDVVAVGAEPLLWAVFCEECDTYIGENTVDENLADATCDAHEKSHKVSLS